MPELIPDEIQTLRMLAGQLPGRGFRAGSGSAKHKHAHRALESDGNHTAM
jgi:hypothetical protein